jgi:TonB family protein
MYRVVERQKAIAIRMKYLISGLLCCLTISCIDVRADARKNLEEDLRKIYEHKLLSLRTPYAGNKLQFDSQGKLIGAANACPWSICGMLQVENLVLAPGRLEISGKRVILALRSNQTDVKVIPLVTDRGVRIRVDLPPSALDIPQVNNTLSSAFEGRGLLERVSSYWKPKVDLGGPDSVEQIKAIRTRTPNAIVAELEGNRPVYLANPGIVDPPKPIHTPEPEYTETARQQRVTGTTIMLVVVNEKGFPEILEITKGLGGDLDIRALTAVAGWTFKPAMKNGEPVAVLINVQVEFHLQ